MMLSHVLLCPFRNCSVDIASAVDGVRDLNRKNVMCIADVITGVIPANTEPVFGQCNLTTGGSCIVACKSGYKASSSRNLAIDRPVHPPDITTRAD